MKPIRQEDKRKGIIVTIIVHLAVLMWLIYLAMQPLPDPPFPEEKVLMVMDFSGGGGSKGGAKAEEVVEETTAKTEETTESSNSSEEVVTQTEDSPVESSSAPASSHSDNSSAEKEEKQKPKYGNLGGAFGGGSGDDDTGNGDGGSGGGIGGGNGPKVGDGNGIGDGTGRVLTYKPDFTNPTQETGRVVVAITINREGKVIKAVAKPGNKGTTTSNVILHRSAEKQAKMLRFNPNPNPNGPKYDKMATTIVFTLN